jgi:cell division protease FtsH
MVLAFVSTLIAGPTTQSKELTYTQFIQLVQKGEIQSAEVDKNLVVAIPVSQPKPVKNSDSKLMQSLVGTPQTVKLQYKVSIPDGANFTLLKKLEDANVQITAKKPSESSQIFGILGSVILPLLFVVFLIIMIRSIQSGGAQAMSFGKSKAKMLLDSKVKTKFADVAGIDEEKKELEEIVDFLKHSEKYIKLGAKIPKGVLLVGAPGTGKTLMAKAVAGEAGVPFFSISGSDFVEMFVGVGASRVRDLFDQAKKHQPCIIFIDEIDAVGRQRGAGLGGGHDEREQTLNQLLVEMDGFDKNTNIIVIAATNRPDILDNALLRPGRFDRQIVINKPDVLGREKILKVHAKNKPLADEVDLKILAKRTPGFTGADLQNLLNEAALLAARHNKHKIEMPDLEEAIDKIMAGPEKKSRIISDEEKENTAYHEVGHALLAKLLTGCDPLHKVSIIPRGMALGVTMTLPEKDYLTMKKSQLLDRITMTLGGRVAEELIYGADSITTGASNDLEKVSSLARKMVTTYGMSEKMGNLTYGKSDEHVFMGRDFGHNRDFSEEIAAEIDREVKKIVDERYNLAKELLSNNKDMLEFISKALLDRETLDEKEFDELMEIVNQQRQNNQNEG